MNIAEMAKGKQFKVIPTPGLRDGKPPICVLCENRIETENCLVGLKGEGFYLHPICGNNIGVQFG